MSGKVETVKYLLESSDDPQKEANVLNNGGWPPMNIAIKIDSRDIVETLCEAGTDLSQKDILGYTPVCHALLGPSHYHKDLEGADVVDNLITQPPDHVILESLLKAARKQGNDNAVKRLEKALKHPNPVWTAYYDLVAPTARLVEQIR